MIRDCVVVDNDMITEVRRFLDKITIAVAGIGAATNPLYRAHGSTVVMLGYLFSSLHLGWSQVMEIYLLLFNTIPRWIQKFGKYRYTTEQYLKSICIAER